MQVTKQFTFSAAHRLCTHTGLCANIHGHNYVLEVTIVGEINEDTGMVLDFSTMKKKIDEYLTMYDHALILNRADPLMDIVKIGKVIIMDGEPTVENMAEMILMDLRGDALDVVKIRLYETEDTYVEIVY